MLNICLKLCSRPKKKKKALRIAFHGIHSETVIIVDSSEMSQTICELLSDKETNEPKVTGGILNHCLCIFIIICPVFQEENMSESLKAGAMLLANMLLIKPFLR